MASCTTGLLPRTPLRAFSRYSTRSIKQRKGPLFRRSLHTGVSPTNAHRAWTRPSAAVFAAAATIAFVYNAQYVHAESPEEQPELVIEKSKKKKGASKEENRDLISSQHLQVKKSWENPGVYVWGSNTGGVADPATNDSYVKTARRIPYFDDLLLRDLKLDRQFGAAILENGDLVQWGKGYSEDSTLPTVTLRGKNLTSIAISKDRVIGLSKSGSVYSIPASKRDQEDGPRVSESSWIPFWGSSSKISYRKLQPQNLGYN
jgi:alpha-tubulin suppressor-like RCC1 family protein